jgi:hypothetical protein
MIAARLEPLPGSSVMSPDPTGFACPSEHALHQSQFCVTDVTPVMSELLELISNLRHRWTQGLGSSGTWLAELQFCGAGELMVVDSPDGRAGADSHHGQGAFGLDDAAVPGGDDGIDLRGVGEIDFAFDQLLRRTELHLAEFVDGLDKWSAEDVRGLDVAS